MTIEGEFVSPLGDKEALLFRSLLVHDELGRLPETRVELLRHVSKGAVKPKDLLGLNAGVRLLLPDESYRYFNGVVTRFERGGMVGRFDIYRLELRPWLWQLTLDADCRVFQDKTVVQILDAIFAEYSAASLVEKKLNASYSARPYTVQYRESDYNFITRLMEDEGIYFYFKHTEGKHTLVLADGPSAHQPKAGAATLLWLPKQTDNTLREDVITHWYRAHALQPTKYAHTDFAAEAPTTDLLAAKTRTSDYPLLQKPLEVFDYPGGHDDIQMAGAGSKKTDGERTAQFEVDRWESQHSVAAALTIDRQVAVGSTFTLKDHPSDDGGFLITAAVFEASFTGYEASDEPLESNYSCRMDCVPKAVKFRPERLASQPVVHGPQTATVTGPSGDEIHTDKYGRVKIHFHWDRKGTKDEKSSCFVRVAQPWASKQFGFINLPRVGDEVVVSFLEGNPDRPLITGRVYNGDNMPPYALPAQATVTGIKSRSSKGGEAANNNELRFDDKKGSEYVWFHAEKDFQRVIKNDLKDKVGNNSQFEVTKNHVAKIGEAFDLEIGKAAALKIGADTHTEITGDLNLNVKAGTNLKLDDKLALKVAQALQMSAGMALDIDAGQGIKINAGSADMSIKAALGINVDGGMTISLKAGPSSVVIGPDGVSITGPMVKINSGGSPGNAAAAAKASPATPTAPKAVAENKDPLAK